MSNRSFARLRAAVLLYSMATAVAAAPPAAKSAAGGVTWSVPARWSEQPGGSMRVATYSVPAAKAAEAGECAVFFFGAGQGGGVDANVERWSKQFEGSPKAERSARKVNNLSIALAQIAGVYLAPGGAMMQSQGKRPGYRLIGAIVEAPQGDLFFKLTGPAATVAAAQADFDTLLASLK